MSELKLGKDFYIALTNMANKFGISPENFLLFFTSESGLDPSAGHGNNNAAGLNQMMSFILPKVGWTKGTKEFSELPAAEQIPYIEKYFEMNFKWVGKPSDYIDLYLINFVPACFSLPWIRQKKMDGIIASKNPSADGSYHGYAPVSRDYEIQIYNSNSGFDNDHDGVITYGDIVRHLEGKKSNPAFQQSLKELHEATGKEIEIPDLNKRSKPVDSSQSTTPTPTPTSTPTGLIDPNQLSSFFKSLSDDNIQRIVKLAYIRKLPSGKYRVFSEKGKNMGTYSSRSGAKNRLRQIEYFKHNADDGMFEDIDLTDIDELSYSAIMRKINKNNYTDFGNDFVNIYKKIFDELYIANKLNESICLKITLNKLKDKYNIKLNIKKEAEETNIVNLAKFLGNMVLFLMGRIKPENRRRVLENLIVKIYNLSESELSSKKMPAGASIGQSIVLCKTLLMGKPPIFIRNVINEIVKYLRANNV